MTVTTQVVMVIFVQRDSEDSHEEVHQQQEIYRVDPKVGKKKKSPKKF